MVQGSIQHLVPIPRGTIVCSMLEHDFIWIGTQNEIILIDPKTLERIASWEPHDSFVVSLAQASANMIWSACSNGEIGLWEVCGMQISCIQKRVEQIGQHIVSLHTRGENEIVCTADCHLLLWDTQVCIYCLYIQLLTIFAGH